MPSPKIVPEVGVDEGSGDSHGILQKQHVEDSSQNDQRDERGQESAQPQIADQQAVDETDRRPAGKGGRNNRGRLATPATLSRVRATKLPRAKVEPTLKSMPPATITIIRANTIKANSPHWRVRLEMLAAPKKSGISDPNTAATATRIKNGIALSTQRLVGSRREDDRARGGSASARYCLTGACLMRPCFLLGSGEIGAGGSRRPRHD